MLYDLVAKYTRTNRSVQLLTNIKHATRSLHHSMLQAGKDSTAPDFYKSSDLAVDLKSDKTFPSATGLLTGSPSSTICVDLCNVNISVT